MQNSSKGKRMDMLTKRHAAYQPKPRAFEQRKRSTDTKEGRVPLEEDLSWKPPHHECLVGGERKSVKVVSNEGSVDELP